MKPFGLCEVCGGYMTTGHMCAGAPPVSNLPFSQPIVMGDAAVKALTDEIVRLSGVIHVANAERDKAKQERDEAVRSEQECRGIVLTYGRVHHEKLMASNEERMVFTIDRSVLRAAGRDGPMLFVDSLKKWMRERSAALAIRRSGDDNG
jgi:hypothetical protein